MKKNRLISFFTNKMYRKATIELFKAKILQLPGIRNILSLWVKWRFVKRTQHMDSWDRYVEFKRMEYEAEQFVFCSKLVRLYACIVSEVKYRNDADFLRCKQEVLECKIIQEEELRGFREYVQQIGPNETDGTRIKAVFDSYTSKLEMAN
ncbi:MAG: hypothetical protein IJE68_04615 [Clostridia bacterium]|nr:hypothetical protein [Clostridia bacterium]